MNRYLAIDMFWFLFKIALGFLVFICVFWSFMWNWSDLVSRKVSPECITQFNNAITAHDHNI